jgi:hypothetical protein
MLAASLPAEAAGIKRLPPTAFPGLPEAVTAELSRRGCKIPQATGVKGPNNVVSGEFVRRGETAWAVLCTVRGTTSVLVFSPGAKSRPAVVGRLGENIHTQKQPDGSYVYARALWRADRKYILERNAGNPELPRAIDHHGVNDYFLEKASTVHYFNGRRWLELRGAD